MSSNRILLVVILTLLLAESILGLCEGDKNAFETDCSNYCTQNCNKPEACLAVCISGCSCKRGFLYDEMQDKCVRRENCSQCEGDENAYETDCSNYCTQNCNKPEACLAVCISGCSCKRGFLYDEMQDKCVRRENCSQCEGDENAYETDCSNYCTQNCNKPEACLAVCISGCSCKTGFLYDEMQDKCVRRENCSQCEGDENAYETDCSNYCTQNCDGPDICTLQCVSGCSCKEGFLYDRRQQKCVRPESCSARQCDCDENAVETNCSNYCTQNCDQRGSCLEVCISGCSCKRGYLYDKCQKKCVCPEKCSVEDC